MTDTASESAPVATIYYLAALLARQWVAIVLSVALCTGLAIAFAYILPVKYRAEALLQPADQDAVSQLNGLAAQFGVNVGGGNTAALEAQAILESKSFTMEFIRRNNLLPVLFADKWDASQRRWTVSDPRDVPTDLDGYRKFRDSVREVTRDRTTGQVLLAVTWSNGAQAAAWTNQMIAMLNATVRRRALDETRESLRYLQAEYQKATLADVRASLVSLMTTELNKSMIANVRHEYAFRVIDPAAVPNRRSSPNRVLIAACGVAVGLALGVVAALLLDYRRKLPQA